MWASVLARPVSSTDIFASFVLCYHLCTFVFSRYNVSEIFLLLLALLLDLREKSCYSTMKEIGNKLFVLTRRNCSIVAAPAGLVQG